MQVLSILNSTAIICNTTIGDGSTVKFDNNIVDHLMLETTLRGTTSANGLNDGNNTVIGVNSFFTEDLLVGDIICFRQILLLKHKFHLLLITRKQLQMLSLVTDHQMLI